MSSPFSDNPQFACLLAGREDQVDLVRLMLEFATDEYPALDVQGPLTELARLGQAAQEAVAESGREATERLQAVSELLYGQEGFRGNHDAYYDPRNSYLNEVLERRLGIPISLAIVYTAVGRQAGLDLFGVGSPGHFMVGCHDGGRTLYVDPFDAGTVLDEQACRERIERVLGQQNVLSSEHLRAATPREIAARVLRNLKAAYAMRDSWPEALPIQLRLVALLPELPDERRDLGLIYLRNSDPHPAAKLLEEYIDKAPPADAEAVLPFLKSARRMVAERN
ncbi:MAG TPA: transglutaminase-like domain-containing protein [Pirellulales bacterium]|nr:transglutaminase-like domain-containing protein [Pirellulales bacterium]